MNFEVNETHMSCLYGCISRPQAFQGLGVTLS